MLLKRSAVLITVFTFIWVILPHIIGHTWDMWAWKDWAVYIHKNGLQNIYRTDTDYLPIYHYELWLYTKISGSEKAIEAGINTVRLFTLAFDALALWYVYKWTDKKIEFYLLFVLCVLNVSYSYNTIMWGQMDGMLTAFVFVALYYVYRQKMVLSSLFIVLALNFKLQAIVFVPAWGLLMLNNIVINRSVRKLLWSVAAMVMLQFLIVLPFILNGTAGQVWRVATGSVGAYPYLGMGAMNLWSIVFDAKTNWVHDDQIWLAGLTCKQAGLIMFFSASFLVLLPFIIRIIKNAKNQTEVVISKQQLWLTCALLSMLFYFFNTQMHERYIHPAYIFIMAYAIVSKDIIPLAIFAFAYLMNLEVGLGALRIRDNNSIITNDIFVATLYAITIVYLSVRLYLLYRKDAQKFEGNDAMPIRATT